MSVRLYVFPHRVELTQQEAEIAALVGVRRYIDSAFKGLRETISERNAHRDVEGACAEMAVAKALGLFFPVDTGRFKTKDIGHIHVRHTELPHGSLIIRPGDPDGLYLLVTGKCPVYTIVGALHSYAAKQPQYWRAPNGGPGAWFVPQHKLETSIPERSLIPEEVLR